MIKLGRTLAALTFVASCGLLATSITEAEGWTFQDCVEVNFNHPDCAQYPTTSTSSTSPTSTSTSTTTVETSPSSTISAPSSTVDQPTSSTLTSSSGCGLVGQIKKLCSTTTEQQGFAVARSANTGPDDQLPFTGISIWTLIFGLACLISGGVALLSVRRKHVDV